MRLLLVRHAEALSPEIDPHQPLSEEGKRQAECVAHFLSERGVSIEVLYHSTKLRAKQTAEILGKRACPRTPLVEKEGLKPMDPILPLIEEIPGFEASTLIVSHLPFLAHLLSTLLGGALSEGFADLCGASVVCLEGTHPRWTLAWLVTPKLLGLNL